jgi:dissimilatory sulfite reductase (desulfoviridin) alpha/beta subunit
MLQMPSNTKECMHSGHCIQDIPDASQYFKKRYACIPVDLDGTLTPSEFSRRLAYESLFVDRQMVIQILYDNLRNKIKPHK